MLMFVFGAGASFDSDPTRRYSGFTADNPHRPPLAAGIFAPQSDRGRRAIGRYPRAAPLIMELRQAVERGEDIEEAMESLARDEDYPETAPQLLAFRAYLADLLSEVPEAWSAECQALTNYVTLLGRADRWATATGSDAIACVTFNYDTLVEQAVERVYGHAINSLDSYCDHARLRLYKPHGSANWQQPARWSVDGVTTIGSKEQALARAISEASTLDWDVWDEWRINAGNNEPQDPSDKTKVWLPALSIPIRHKADFSMPSWHRERLEDDLREVTTLIAVGWRGRERHFLQLIQDHMPSSPAKLVVVGSPLGDARSTADSLWETGRFDRYTLSGIGFSAFLDEPSNPEPLSLHEVDQGHVRLKDVLSEQPEGLLWTSRAPGNGLPPLAAPEPRFANHARL